MRNLDKYAVALCKQFARIGPCHLYRPELGCDDCELQGICSNPDKLLAFMMQSVDEYDQQLLREP